VRFLKGFSPLRSLLGFWYPSCDVYCRCKYPALLFLVCPFFSTAPKHCLALLCTNSCSRLGPFLFPYCSLPQVGGCFFFFFVCRGMPPYRLFPPEVRIFFLYLICSLNLCCFSMIFPRQIGYYLKLSGLPRPNKIKLPPG